MSRLVHGSRHHRVLALAASAAIVGVAAVAMHATAAKSSSVAEKWPSPRASR